MKRQELILTAGVLLCFSLSGPLRADIFTGTVAAGSPAQFLLPSNAGDMLDITVNSTPPGTLTELQLFDPSANFVAIAQGNGADGESSVIDFTAVSSGNYTLDLVDPGVAAFNFSLEIEGNTGGAVSQIASAPEPSSVSLCFLVVIGLVIGKLRTRRSHLEIS